MTKRIRTALFWLLTLLFLILAPVIVLYTLGFRYDFRSGTIEHTGILSITTAPRSATIFVDEIQARATTPTLVQQLLPRDHIVRLEKTGFFSYEKTVPIIEKQTTFLESVVLWLEAKPELSSSLGNVHLIDPAHTALASLENVGAWTEVWVERLDSGTRTMIARFAGSSPGDIGAEWSPDGTLLLLGTSTELIAVDTNTKNSHDIQELVTAPIKEAWWDQGQSHNLFVRTASRVLRISLQDNLVEPILSEPSPALETAKGHLFFTRDVGNQTHVLSQNNDREETVAILPLGPYRFIESPLPYLLLFHEQRGRLILIDSEIRDQPILLNTEAFEGAWSKNHQKLLYTNGLETHIFTPDTLEDRLITRVSQPVTSVGWHPAGSAIVLAKPDGVFAFDLHPWNGYVQTKLNNARDVSRVFIDDKEKTLYFLGSVDGVYGFYRQAIR